MDVLKMLDIEDIDSLLEAYEKIALYDHSISVPELGSVFSYDESTVVGRILRYIEEVYNVEHAWISTNGTTALNVLGFLSLTDENDMVLVQRDSHISVLSAIIQGNLVPKYILPEYDKEIGLPIGILKQHFEEKLQEENYSAVFLTYPNYFGYAPKYLEDLVKMAQKSNVKVMIDAAHGAYFRYHELLPEAAEHSGADIVVQSIHKTTTALSQGSLALFNNNDIVEKFYEHVNNLGCISTSFSFVILFSVFLSITHMILEGRNSLEKVINHLNKRKNSFKSKAFKIVDISQKYPDFYTDPLRLTIDVSNTGYTGYQIEELLIKDFKIYPEMATLRHVLFLFTPNDREEDIDKVFDALQKISGSIEVRKGLNLEIPYYPFIPDAAMNPREAYFSKKRKVPVEEAAGKISGETISAYPPGSAVIVAGEFLTNEIIEYLKELKEKGATLKGASDKEFKYIKIIDS